MQNTPFDFEIPQNVNKEPKLSHFSQFIEWAKTHFEISSSLQEKSSDANNDAIKKRIDESLRYGKHILASMIESENTRCSHASMPLSGSNRFSQTPKETPANKIQPNSPNRLPLNPLPSRTYISKKKQTQ